jgi:hypothetical protein
MYDIAKALTCTDAATRRKVEDEFFEIYIEHLKNNVDPEDVKLFSVEKVILPNPNFYQIYRVFPKKSDFCNFSQKFLKIFLK